MERLDEPIVLDTGTTFTHKEKMNNRWYYIRYCGVCGNYYKTETYYMRTGHNSCIAKNKLDTYN